MWLPDLGDHARPHYLAIADAIAEDIRVGRLRAEDRLPPQRHLAARLDLNFTTVARGYVEAQRRGLVESRVGAGTFVRSQATASAPARSIRRTDLVDFSMNLPPEPDDPALLERMRRAFTAVGGDLTTLLRYQGFGGTPEDKDAALGWLTRRHVSATRDRLLICPGTHSALLAIIGSLARPGEAVACEMLTYPGLKAIAGQQGVRLVGVESDAQGMRADALEAACAEGAIKALYCNPTLLNPTTATITAPRRLELIEVARKHSLRIIEDDAYALVPRQPPPAFATLAPDITYYVMGLAKCLGAGLRISYLVLPEGGRSWAVATALRAANVMASPITSALASRWIAEGIADDVLEQIRVESRARQELARESLAGHEVASDPEGFHLWITLPPHWTRSALTGQLRTSRIGVVASDAFAVGETPPEAVRACLGGFTNRAETRHALEFLAEVLNTPPSMMSGVI
ncbi:DNA-binding transcriptional regulator, MocR family, contains an aminotransferase domain [Arboricoccus pini]|uniref:DNA-binding transcriptional regulator, MocR family, contains an aminotransferase domain n=1 Tax=Arboricoccus pini TaxID=1963835 RepID=A0A212RL38_9PROT|nr:PLP-dependent aminotransferase family protein [Arboricoccus pini]SNB73033.1 DNA-binding transcriptional regulator, MocR family, contains an aminotransferase domain [Arboricoccus pini]